MRHPTPEQIGLDYEALLQLLLLDKQRFVEVIGKERILEFIGKERVLDLIGAEAVLQWLQRHGHTITPPSPKNPNGSNPS